MRTLILNQTNIVPDGQNNKLVYRFPNSVTFKNQEIAFASATMYFSWENINISYQNNTFTYNWINGGGVATTYTVTIPNGTWEISAINAYLQYVFIQNGHYLVNGSGDNVYYAEFLVNPERYAIQINTFLFPTALPAGWSNPAAVPFPPQSFNPIITLPAKFNEIMGYVVGFATDQNLNNAYVPPVSQFVSKLANGTLSYISTTFPNVQPNSSILFSISNIDNSYATPSSILYTLTPSVSVGQVISERVPEFAWLPLINGTTSELRLTILGTDLNPIQLKDPQITIVLVIKDKLDFGMIK
jgi:hypothetical protein